MSDDKNKDESLFDKLRRETKEQLLQQDQEEKMRQSMLEDWQRAKPLVDKWNNPGGVK